MAQVTVERLGHKGDGIAPGPVFVSRALPGEVVEGDIVDGAMARPKIVLPSSDRKAAPCRHYRACGGCGLQHASDEQVARFKTDVVRSALEAQRIESDVSLIHTSPPGSRRRAAFSGRRTRSGAVVGFHAPQSDILTAVPDCLVLRPALRDALPAFEAITTAFGSRRSEMRFVATETSTGLDVNVEGPPLSERAQLEHAIAIARDAGLARLAWNGERIATFSDPDVAIDGVDVALPVGGFLQATAEAERALTKQVLIDLDGTPGPVADLFSGIGTFTLPIVRTRDVAAFESDARAVEALDHAWRHAKGLRSVDAIRRDLFRQPLLPDEIDRFAAVVLDPPRAGAQAQIAEIAASNLAKAVYVSCSPKTFARDAAVLQAAGFRVGPVSVIDQFRWSHHVELIAAFDR